MVCGTTSPLLRTPDELGGCVWVSVAFLGSVSIGSVEVTRVFGCWLQVVSVLFCRFLRRKSGASQVAPVEMTETLMSMLQLV